MPKDAAFWQFLYLIFAKLHDEKLSSDYRRFFCGPTEAFDHEGQKRIRERINQLFGEVKNRYPAVFRGNEEITLSDRALAFMVNELAKYDMGRTEVDAKGAAYQEIVGTNLRGDRGQYFTPRGVVKLMVEILDPQPDERVLDPACGTGGFLVATLDYMMKRFGRDAGLQPHEIDTEAYKQVLDRLTEYAQDYVFGADFDQFLVRASTMNFAMATNTSKYDNIFHMDSLAFPDGHLDGRIRANERIPQGSLDVIMTNPPFGSDIPITDSALLNRNVLAKRWDRDELGALRNTGMNVSSVAPEVLFIEQSVRWLKPGGRMGIVLPNGILGNPGDEFIRRWILRNCWVLASVEIPVEAFIVDANVNILTSLLFLKKKTDDEIRAEDYAGPQDYPVFMAVAEKVGFDRRGNTLYKRRPDGEEIVVDFEEPERVHLGGKWITRTLTRKQKIVDNDLPVIAEEYRKFRTEHQEPGA